MAKEQNTILHRWFEEVWNNGRAELIDEMIAPNAIAHGLEDPNGNEVRGPEEFKKFHHSFRSAFPDIHISIEEMVSEGDLVVGYCKIKATHTGAGFGMESTGKPVAFEGMLMFRVRDGKVVEAWNSFDFLKMFQQMGVVKLAGG